MSTKIDVLKMEIARIERELEDAKRRLKKFEERGNGGPSEEAMPFTRLAGILKGKVHFTEEDIEAAKIKARDLD